MRKRDKGREREREKEREGERERERERERSPRRLCTVSTEPDVGLELMIRAIMT